MSSRCAKSNRSWSPELTSLSVSICQFSGEKGRQNTYSESRFTEKTHESWPPQNQVEMAVVQHCHFSKGCRYRVRRMKIVISSGPIYRDPENIFFLRKILKYYCTTHDEREREPAQASKVSKIAYPWWAALRFSESDTAAFDILERRNSSQRSFVILTWRLIGCHVAAGVRWISINYVSLTRRVGYCAPREQRPLIVCIRRGIIADVSQTINDSIDVASWGRVRITRTIMGLGFFWSG